MMRLVMPHCRSMCVDGLVPLWCLQGASSISSKLMARLAGLPALGCRVSHGLDGRDEPVVIVLSRLVGLALVVLLVVLLPAAFACRLRRGNRHCFAGFI